MKKSVDFLKNQLTGIRPAGISSKLIENIKVNHFRIRDVANISKNQNGLVIHFWMPEHIGDVLHELQKQSFNAYKFSKDSIVVTVAMDSGEQRAKVAKQIAKFGEEAKIAVRNVRKSYRGKIEEKDLQRLVDFYINEIERVIAALV